MGPTPTEKTIIGRFIDLREAITRAYAHAHALEEQAKFVAEQRETTGKEIEQLTARLVEMQELAGKLEIDLPTGQPGQPGQVGREAPGSRV